MSKIVMSVRLSAVTYYVKAAEHILKLFLPPGSYIILVGNSALLVLTVTV